MLKALIERWRLVTVVSVCVMVFAATGWTSLTSSRQNKDVEVVNQLTSFQVISIDKAENEFHLRLKNISNKEINGYTLLLGDGGTLTTDYTNTDRVLAPEEIAEVVIPCSDSLTQERITLLSVVFTDNSSEGDSHAEANIKYRRLGVKMQLKRILPLLREMMSAQETDISAALNRLKSQIQLLPEQADDGLPPAVGDGLYDAKQDALRLFRRLEQKQVATRMDFREELSKELAKQEKRVSRLK